MRQCCADRVALSGSLNITDGYGRHSWRMSRQQVSIAICKRSPSRSSCHPPFVILSISLLAKFVFVGSSAVQESILAFVVLSMGSRFMYLGCVKAVDLCHKLLNVVEGLFLIDVISVDRTLYVIPIVAHGRLGN